MGGLRRRIADWFRSILSYTWQYMGTISAMGLFLGVLGMGIYHVLTPVESALTYKYFNGVFNPAEAQLPRGLGEIVSGGENGACLVFEYERGGRLKRFFHVDNRGDVSRMSGSKVAEQRMEYDAAGRLVSRPNYVADGKLAPDAAGVAVREFSYNEKGLLTGRAFRDAVGRKIVPRMPGFAEERITYDEEGRPVMIQYLDGEGKEMVNARGESCITFTYDDSRQEMLRTNTVNGMIADNADGVAQERVCYTRNGLTTHTSWKNAAGESVQHSGHGATSVLKESRPDEKLMRTRYCCENGVMREDVRVWAEHLVRSTPHGQVEWECFNAADGLPCDNPACGYAERVCEYAADGSLQREYFWDALGNPAECYEKRHSGEGSAHHVLSLNSDGSTSLTREE